MTPAHAVTVTRKLTTGNLSTTRSGTPQTDWTRQHRRILVLAILWVFASLFYFWTATSSDNPIVFHAQQTDYYNQLANGFLKGELSIPKVPPTGLVHLADPYDPNQNAPYQAQFHDLSLYHGHFYLSWGPTPVLTLFIPWRVLGVGALAPNLAALIYSVVGLAFALSLLELLIARFFPSIGTFKTALGGLVLATSSVIPYLLRRPLFYEDAISCAYCFVGAGLYFLVRALLNEKRRTLSLILGSTSLGLAIGARFETLAFGMLILAVAYHLDRRAVEPSRASRLRQAAATILPWAACALLVFVYNFARFGNPLQIGSAYQLAGFDPTKTPYEQLSYLAPSIYYYIFAPIRFTLAFPFISLPPPAFYPGPIPEAYRPEVIGGLFSTTPILLMLLGATWLLRKHLTELGHLVLALCATALVILAAISLTVPGGTMRYETDFASLLLLGAVLTWFAWSPPGCLPRFAVNVFGGALILFGSFVGISLSLTGPNDQLHAYNIATYQDLENQFAFVPELITKIEGRARVVRVIDPEAGYPMDLNNYGTYDVGDLRFTLLSAREEIDIVAPDSHYYVISSRLERTVSAPASGPIEIHVQVGRNTSSSTLSYGHLFSVKVRLDAGLNRIYAWVTFTGPQPPGAYPDIINVYGLTVQSVASS
jgi:hypothetical protein